MDYRADIRLPVQAFCDDLCTLRAFLQDGCPVMGLHRLGTRRRVLVVLYKSESARRRT